MKLELLQPPIHEDQDGVVRVNQTKVTLDAVVFAFRDGASAEEIVARFPDLSLSAVYSTLAYYLQNRDSVDSYVSRRESEAAHLRQQIEARPEQAEFRNRLMSRIGTRRPA